MSNINWDNIAFWRAFPDNASHTSFRHGDDMFLLVIACLLGYVVVLARVTRWSLETAPFFVISSIVSILYLAALIDLLKYAAIFLVFLGLCCFILSIIWLIRSPRDFFGRYLPVGIIIFILAAIWLWIKVHAAYFSTWDDFIHWGFVSKAIFLHQGLVNGSGLLLHPTYPPGSALFHYFVYSVVGYSEGAAFFAQGLLLFSPMVLLFKFRRASFRWFWILFALIFYYFALFTFGLFLHGNLTSGKGVFLTLYVDWIIAAFFGGGLLMYFTSSHVRASIIRLIPVIVCLPLFKSIGGFFAAMLIFIILVDLLIRFAGQKKGREIVKYIFTLLIILMISIGSWKVYTHYRHATSYFKTQKVTVKKIDRMLFSPNKLQPWQQKVISNYPKAVRFYSAGSGKISLGHKGHLNLSTDIWAIFLILLVLMIGFSLHDRKERMRFFSINLILAAGLFIYLFGLLVLYVYVFPHYEASYYASIFRYTGLYIFAWTFFIFGSFLYYSQKTPMRGRGLVKLCCGVILPLICLVGSPVFAWRFLIPVSYDNLSPVRIGINRLLNQIKSSESAIDSAYIIVQPKNLQPREVVNASYFYQVIRYNLLPIRTNDTCWMFLEHLTPGRKLFACHLTSKELKKRIAGYQCVWMIFPDRYLKKKHSFLFNKTFQKTRRVLMIKE